MSRNNKIASSLIQIAENTTLSLAPFDKVAVLQKNKILVFNSILKQPKMNITNQILGTSLGFSVGILLGVLYCLPKKK